MRRMKPATTSVPVSLLGAILFAGCGAGSSETSPSLVPPITQNATVIGQYNLVLTSATGPGMTTIYSNFTQNGPTFAALGNTLVCPSNDVFQCKGDDPLSSITSTGTVSGKNVTIMLTYPTSTGSDTVTLVGSAAGATLTGTYTDTFGDSGTWKASTATNIFGPPPGVYDYSGTFNSTSNPLLIAPSISVELGRDSTQDISNVVGKATIMNSPCIASLNLSGRAIGDAFSLTDAASKVSIIVVPALPAANSFNFRYKFEPVAANCAGDLGLGVLTLDGSPFPWDY